ncbi:esterase-like activity of phytase family protein [Okeania sp. KiyG1]|uniref:choice-of-anchor I domain-containing protein n=1 Tax=Okeania sp. KiyG1 TaxID=2720165 RepID=UPI00192061B6|nr:esterase-like activity of phytase family protein [Okeania sp. KiyG1]GGA12180.1 hypothetical protein CYANOKiyG1_25340 [Okeania sp. KiyG1]
MTDPQLRPLGTYETGIFDESAAEIPAYDPNTQRVFVVKANEAAIDVLDISDPTNPNLIDQIDVSSFGAIANSVAVNQNGIVAVAVEADVKQDPGTVAFFNADGDTLNEVTVGALPDMLTFTSDGTKVLVANEGEPNDDYSNDPEGSVSIIDISGGVGNLTQADVSTADFSDFIGREEELRNKGVRIYGPGSNAAQDLEPEFIAVDGNDTTAFVTLQENNAIAVVDIENANIVDVLPLGAKDYSRGLPSLTPFEFDDSDLRVLDTTEGGQEIRLGGLSGLWYEGEDEDGNLQFVTVPDRGPNGAPTDVDDDGDNERPFALPDYQARIVRFTLDEDSGDIDITEEILLNRQDGTTPITGLPNIPGVDEEPVDLFGNPLEYDPFGADMEGIVINDDGTYWTVDEYRPAIYHFDVDGSLIDRFVPEGTAALAGETEGTFGTETLPAEYSNRRRNRGFEAIALDTDEDILYSFIQTPLANPDRTASDDSSVIRMLGIDPETGEPVAEYVYLLEKPTINPDNGSLLVDKIGDAVYDADADTFYILERDSSTTATGKKFIFEIDLKGATNLLADDAPSLPENTTLEQLDVDEIFDLDIQPVNKTKITNLPSLGYLAGDKPEGLSLLPDGRLAVLNDNDFGLLDEEIPGDGTVPLNPEPVPVVLGLIDFSESNQIDPSDRDDGINLGNWPVFGLLQPDSIASFVIEGETYYVTADEGDARGYDALDEEARVGDDEYVLDPEVFNVAALEDDAAIGRLTVTTEDGDIDDDGDYDQIFANGGRSFSIWDAAGNRIFNSGDSIERITADLIPDNFNSNRDENTFDDRSDNSGPEPEAITTGVLGDKTYTFVGLERTGGIMVYDVSDPTSPDFVQYIPNRDFTVEFDTDADGDPDPTPEQLSAAGDLGPEGFKFISPEDSPNGEALLVVANEISGTTTVYEFSPNQNIQGTPGNNNLEGGTGDDNIDGLAGNDILSGFGGSDTISGSAGNDDINGNGGNDRVSGGNGDDRVNGGLGSDIIFGNNGDDNLIGRLGNDRMLGGPGEDTLSGGIGRDRLHGGADDDILTGGGSVDRFIFAANDEFSQASLGIDEITDFNPDLDLILLDLRTFTEITTTAGEDIGDEFAIVGSNGDAASSEAIIVYNSTNGGLFYNANGSDGGFGDGGRFATLTGTPTISAEDFVIR